MLNTERAIVTDIEGTTRDTIEEFIQIDGIPVKIIDTAGIRDTENAIEKIGIDKTVQALKNADLVITIIDGSKELEEEDKEIIKLIENKKSIVLINKIDKNILVDKEEILKMIEECEVLLISALNKIGIDEVYEKISKMYRFDEIRIDDSLMITNERQKQAIIMIEEHIKKAREAIKNKMPIDIVTINITDILSEIGKITGEGVSEDIINEIFKKFCLGK